MPSILTGAGWKVEVNLPLNDGAVAELDVHGDVGDCLEAQGCDGEGRGEGHVRQASLSLLERTAAGRLHGGTARRCVEEEASWQAAATRAGRGRTGTARRCGGVQRRRVGGPPRRGPAAS